MIDPNLPLEDLFNTDYYGVRWTRPGEERVITWSTTNEVLDVPAQGPASAVADITPYLPDFERAFALWDAALDTISFEWNDDGNAADVTLAITDLGGRGGTWGFWNSVWTNDDIVTRSSIQFDVSDIDEISVVTIALHEIGNVLGLGDIPPDAGIRSIQEDPIPETFTGDALWADDLALIRRYYGEEDTDVPVAPPEPLDRDVVGSAANDRLMGSMRDDIVDGRGGRDTYVRSDGIEGYALAINPDGTLVLSDNGRDVAGTDVLTSIELLEFASGNVWFPDGTVDLEQLTGIARLSAAEISTFVEMYVAYFDRAPDAIGLNYWGTRLSDGMTLDEIAESFFEQAETVALYPPGLDNGALVRAAYNNFLERDPDQAGLDYWTAELDAGFSRGKFMLALINGARANDTDEARLDVATIEAKADIGLHYAVIHGLTNVDHAKDVMGRYGRGEDLSLGDAMLLTDQYADAARSEGAFSDFTMSLVGVVDDPSIGLV